MSDWSLPLTTSDYITVVLPALNAKDVDAATMFYTAPTNQPDHSIKWNRATNKFQEWSTAGAAWTDLTVGTGLGLGTMSTQNSNAITVTGGTLSGITSLSASGGAITGTTTWNAGAITSSGAGTFAGQIVFTANAATQTAGSIAKNAYYGIALWGVTGSTADFGLVNNAGNEVLYVPAGTTEVRFSGAITARSSPSVLNITFKNTIGAGQGDVIVTLDKAASGNSAYIAYKTGGADKWALGTGIAAIDDNFRLRNQSSGFSPITTYTSGSVSIGEAADNGNPGTLTIQTSIINKMLSFLPTADNSGGGYAMFRNAALTLIGSITQNVGATATLYNTTSDKRLKDDHGLASDLSGLKSVKVHDFSWKGTNSIERGVFAQEAVKVFPRAVTVGKDTLTESGALEEPWMTDYSKFIPDLVVGWQQHEERLARLETRLSD